MSRLGPLLAANVGLLGEASRIIRDLRDGDYARIPDESPGGGVGAQFRHVMEFYACLIGGLETGRVDYDRRPRDGRLERDRAAALTRLEELALAVQGLAGADPDAGLEVSMDRDDREAPAWSRSSLHRELRFLESHTIHHFALVRWMLRSFGVDVPVDVGVAPSTRGHWARRGA